MEGVVYTKNFPPRNTFERGKVLIRVFYKMNLDTEQKEFITKIVRDFRRFQTQKRLKKVKPLPKPSGSLIAGMKIQKHRKPTLGYQKWLDEIYFQRKLDRIFTKIFSVSHTNNKTFWGIFGAQPR